VGLLMVLARERSHLKGAAGAGGGDDFVAETEIGEGTAVGSHPQKWDNAHPRIWSEPLSEVGESAPLEMGEACWGC
jgi:hypothetical protein